MPRRRSESEKQYDNRWLTRLRHIRDIVYRPMKAKSGAPLITPPAKQARGPQRTVGVSTSVSPGQDHTAVAKFSELIAGSELGGAAER